jgi:hypothetical protein
MLQLPAEGLDRAVMFRLTGQTGVILSEISEGMSLITICHNWNSGDCTGRCVVNRTISVRSMTALSITLSRHEPGEPDQPTRRRQE